MICEVSVPHTLLLCGQGYKTCWEYRPVALASAAFWSPAFFRWAVDKTATLAAGAVLLQFIAEQVEEWGLGDGVSMIICLSVLTSASR
jgi:preprotein translocase subunit SecY